MPTTSMHCCCAGWRTPPRRLAAPANHGADDERMNCPAARSEPAGFPRCHVRPGAAVNIITTDGPPDAPVLPPPRCAASVIRRRRCWFVSIATRRWASFRDNGVLCVNTLAAGQESLSTLFGGKTPMTERFAAARWHAAQRRTAAAGGADGVRLHHHAGRQRGDTRHSVLQRDGAGAP